MGIPADKSSLFGVSPFQVLLRFHVGAQHAASLKWQVPSSVFKRKQTMIVISRPLPTGLVFSSFMTCMSSASQNVCYLAG